MYLICGDPRCSFTMVTFCNAFIPTSSHQTSHTDESTMEEFCFSRRHCHTHHPRLYIYSVHTECTYGANVESPLSFLRPAIRNKHTQPSPVHARTFCYVATHSHCCRMTNNQPVPRSDHLFAFGSQSQCLLAYVGASGAQAESASLQQAPSPFPLSQNGLQKD
ncbi:hypothetical protein K439DRAFT_776000 [Ramaria rubella]|nr:hypothetical protein K439DRAFT_776000 [Ramaria rubella]